MTDHKHQGLESYMHNPGVVEQSARGPEVKEEHAPDPGVQRRPAVPLPAIPTENGRAVFGLDLGERTAMSSDQMTSKGIEQELEVPLPAEMRDII